MTGQIPIIDLGAPEGEASAAIGRAARDRGFFYVSNHGVAPALLSGIYAAAAAFFAQPDAAKLRIAHSLSPHNRGYVPVDGERLDPSRPSDAKEAFNIGRELPPDHPGIVAKQPFHGPNLWPDLPGFRAAMLAYYGAMRGLGDRLGRAFAIDLGLPPDYFEPLIGDPIATLRLLRYPPHPGTFDGTQYGAGPHTDYGMVTVLAQDDVGGLEVRARDGTWIAAPPIPGTFVCNIGDCLMRWSNDIYVSNPHRVVNRGGRERYSIVYFLDTNADAVVRCLPGCSGPDRPVRYPPISGADFLRSRLESTYEYSLGAAEGA
jgi:isopenicillin N synthase-like dioxygenase